MVGASRYDLLRGEFMLMIKCYKCKGDGTVKMPYKMFLTLNDLKAFPGSTAPDLLRFNAGIGVTAINNRLERLRILGLVRREKSGNAWKYYAI